MSGLSVNWEPESAKPAEDQKKSLRGEITVGEKRYRVTVHYEPSEEDAKVQEAIQGVIGKLSGDEVASLAGYSLRMSAHKTEVKNAGKQEWKPISNAKPHLKKTAEKISKAFQDLNLFPAVVETKTPDLSFLENQITENSIYHWNGEDIEGEALLKELNKRMAKVDKRHIDHIRENIDFNVSEEPSVTFPGMETPFFLSELLDFLEIGQTITSKPIDAFSKKFPPDKGVVVLNTNFLFPDDKREIVNHLSDFQIEQGTRKLLIPYNQGGKHWVFFEVNLEGDKKSITCYDSMCKNEERSGFPAANEVNEELIEKAAVANNIMQWLVGNQVAEADEINEVKVPGFGDQHQTDDANCGRFMLYGMAKAATGHGFNPEEEITRESSHAFHLDLMDLFIRNSE